MKLKEQDDNDYNEAEDEDEKHPFVCSYRFGLAILGFLVFLHNHMQRVSISVAIICMVNHTAVRMLNEDLALNDTFTYQATPRVFNGTLLTNRSDVIVPVCSGGGGNGETNEDGPFVWDKPTQGHILGAYFYGYFVSNFPAGLIAERFGPKWTLTVFYMIGVVATLLTPMAAAISPIFLIILRILLGIGSGALFPCMHAMWSHWAPPMERSKLAGITYAGCMAAAMIGLPLSGVLCKYGFSQGWDSIFYVIGSSSTLVCLAWIVMASNTPSMNPRMPSREKRFIKRSLKGQVSDERNQFALPWLSVLKSGPMWAIIVANFCSDWGLYTLLTNIPTFLSEVLQFNIETNGLFSALPFVGLWINMNVSPIIADKLRSSRVLSTTVTRKVFNTIGLIVPAIFLSALGFVECTQPFIGVGLLTIGVTFSGCAYTGFLVNHMDIAPRYAGTLLGISNGLGAISGFIAPTVAAALTTNQTRSEWQIVFFISGAVYTFGAIIYAVFASGRLQNWAIEDDTLKPEVVELKNGQIDGHVINGSIGPIDDHGQEKDEKNINV